MSAAAVASYKDEYSDFQQRYGEVLITQDHTIVLRCLICNESRRLYRHFLKHILAHYYENQRQMKESKNQIPNVKPEINVYMEAEHCKDELLGEIDDTQTEIILVETEYSDQSAQCVDEIPFPVENCAKNADSTRSCETPPSPPPKRKCPKTSMHTDVKDRKYKCATCGAAFTDYSNMRAHERRHTGQKPYGCEYCEMSFYTNTELDIHRRRHTGERPFICIYCGQKFKSNADLNKHEQRHFNKRTHECKLCDMRFSNVKHLRSHQLVHTQERNHVCSICNERFPRRNSLTVHMKLHLNAREYACDLCDKMFNQKPALLSHRKNKHKVVASNGNHKGKRVILLTTEACARCKLEFIGKQALLEHQRQKHAVEDELVTTVLMNEVESENVLLCE